IEVACSETPSASHAFFVVNTRFLLRKRDCPMSTVFRTDTASCADCVIHRRLPAVMLLHLTCAASASHTDIFETSAESCHFMSLEMTQTDEHICIHNSLSDLRLFDQSSSLNRNADIIGSFQAIPDN